MKKNGLDFLFRDEKISEEVNVNNIFIILNIKNNII